jgi:alcohol dehydrogenase class IV
MHNFVSPKKIVSGEGSLTNIVDIINKYEASKIFIFADPILKKIGVTGKIDQLMEEAGVSYTIYTDIQPEPPLSVGNAAVQAIREFGADLVIGIGGGSCLDIAKAGAVLAKNEGNISDYLNLTGSKKLENCGLPKILIPTTAGTGAEITDIAVFSLEDTKDVITHEYLIADVAIIDPELTYSLPPRITAASGIDALTHAIEAYLSIKATPLTDTLALEAIRKLSGNIRTAVWNGQNKEARKEMAWGSMIAGLSFYNAGVAGVHALAYPLGGLFKIPHGEANAVLLPYVLDYIWPSCLPKMVVLADALGVPVEGKSDREVAITVVQAVHDLVKDVGLPLTIAEYGITEDHLDLLSENGMKQTRLLERSPKSYTLETTKGVFLAALRGELFKGA